MIGKREIPPHNLENFRGMVLYSGYIIDDIRMRCYVPTTIFDPKVAVIVAYRLEASSTQLPNVPELILDEKTVKLHSLPKWNREYQCLELNSEDEKRVHKICDNLEEKLTGQ